MTTVWLCTATGVYDQGCHYVAETLQDAERFCREWSVDKDGYHSWRIDEMRVGQRMPCLPLHPRSEIDESKRWQADSVSVERWPSDHGTDAGTASESRRSEG